MPCGLVNLGSCLPQMFFEFVLSLIMAPVQPILQLTLNLLSEPINLTLFVSLWAIIIYCLSMFYALLIVGSGFSFLLSGYNSEKREQAKEWLRNIIVMIILVQSSFFLYQLVIDLSSTMTSAILSLIDESFFTLSVSSVAGLATSILFSTVYLITLLVTCLILILRYAIVALGVVFLPLGIFLYFIPPLKRYGSLIINFLGITIFITFIDAILLIGFAELSTISIFDSLEIIVLICAFWAINLLMLLLLLFAVVSSALNIRSKVMKVGGLIK